MLKRKCMNQETFRMHNKVLKEKVEVYEDAEMTKLRSNGIVNGAKQKKILANLELNSEAYIGLRKERSKLLSFRKVEQSVLRDEDTGDEAKAWKSLNNKFEASTSASMCKLRQEFNSYTLNGGMKSPDTQLTTLEVIRSKLTRLVVDTNDEVFCTSGTGQHTTISRVNGRLPTEVGG